MVTSTAAIFDGGDMITHKSIFNTFQWPFTPILLFLVGNYLVLVDCNAN